LIWLELLDPKDLSHKEEEVTEWIEQIVQQSLDARTPEQLANALSDGRILCLMMKVLVPGGISNIPSKKTDRVTLFLKQCHRIGVVKDELFDPLDLIHRRNMVKVIYCLHSLAERCHQTRLVPFFTGGKKERMKQREEWKKKARMSMRSEFEGWKINSELLKQIKDQPADSGAGIGFAFRSPIPQSGFSSPPPPSEIEDTTIPEPIIEEPIIEEPVIEEPEPIQTTPLEIPDPRPLPEKREPINTIPTVPRWTFLLDRITDTKASFVSQFKMVDQALIRLLLFWVACVALWVLFFASSFKLEL